MRPQHLRTTRSAPDPRDRGAGARRALRRVARILEAEPGGRPERNPDARPRLETLDDWILFGPRMR
jgi:hypothetical protein